jgi:hypothetical protein
MATLSIHFQAALPSEVLNPLGHRTQGWPMWLHRKEKKHPAFIPYDSRIFTCKSKRGCFIVAFDICIPSNKTQRHFFDTKTFFKDPFHRTYQLGRKQERN